MVLVTPRPAVTGVFRDGGISAIVFGMTASENGGNSAITSAQIRAARALIEWSREKLAGESSVPVRTLDRAEKGIGSPQRRTLAAIRAALEVAGVEFIPENGGGAGVRLRKPGVTQAPAMAPRAIGPEDDP